MSATETDLAITPQERAYQISGNLEAFWKSRLDKKDPVARIGYALWVTDVEKLRQEISKGDPKFWNYKGFSYWEFMARSTVVNLATGLNKGGFRGNFKETREKIKQVGIRVARWHIRFVQDDYKNKTGNIAGKLSLKQMADYHHLAFSEFNIPSNFYGGTWLEAIPDAAEFALYGDLYCHDCDSDEGYLGTSQ
ncbi:hypothetical protein LZP73_05700 [Shewanella sp. AS16]|uniref:hypothetical protein n=1 Tax=Shewanella sp. AS16 TaxID=2907625 RepID=UPI001F3025B3|nr:hypothetical protein [Shewanella sp. AS16]MCE9685710.1 hypothetical protein [Shewanella sp. AS16]